MALSRYEQQALNAIAIELYAEDRKLASRLVHDGWTSKKWRHTVVAPVVFVLGAMLQACGILLPHNVVAGMMAVSILGYIVMFVAGLMWCKGMTKRFPSR